MTRSQPAATRSSNRSRLYSATSAAVQPRRLSTGLTESIDTTTCGKSTHGLVAMGAECVVRGAEEARGNCSVSALRTTHLALELRTSHLAPETRLTVCKS